MSDKTRGTLVLHDVVPNAYISVMTRLKAALRTKPSRGKVGKRAFGKHAKPSRVEMTAEEIGAKVRRSAKLLIRKKTQAGNSGKLVFYISEPSADRVVENVKYGQAALERASSRIVRSGVELKVAPNVPLFHAHPSRRGFLVRVMQGREETGFFRDGNFVIAE